MRTSDRLQDYYYFDADIMSAIDDVAERQNRMSFSELANEYGIASGSSSVLPDGASKPIEILTLIPDQDYDEQTARIYHTAFGYPINDNTALHAMRLFEADSSEQLIVVGNPAMIGTSTGKLTFREAFEVSKDKTLRPAIDPILRYLGQQGITTTSHLGYSYGADRAAATIAYSGEYDQSVSKAVLVEPVSVVKRSMKKLAQDFAQSGQAQKQYVEQTGSKPYDEIWAEDSAIKFAAWAGGLVRVSNLAIAHVIAGDGFAQRAGAALDSQPDLRMTVGWGSKSEICPDLTLQKVTNALRAEHGRDRVRSMSLRGMHHAGVDDLDLHAAMMLEGLRN